MLDTGDVLAHFMTGEAGGMILPNGTIYPELAAARDRGVILDACTGRTHLSFKAAQHALEQGIAPSVISTDTNASTLSDVQSLLVTMSKFVNLGLSVEQVVAMTTANPARMLGEQERRGSMKPGMPADVTVLEVIEGDFLFSDGKAGNTLKGRQLIEPRLVIKNGRMRPCLSRYRLP
jgi:dihydroorotase